MTDKEMEQEVKYMSQGMKTEGTILNALICVKCEEVKEQSTGGLRYEICRKCKNKLKTQMNVWKKHGLYTKPIDLYRESVR